MNTENKKIEIWFDKMSQTLFCFGDGKKAQSSIKNEAKSINEIIEKIKDDVNSTNEEFPDYLRLLKENDGTWSIEGFFDENVGCDENGRPSIVDFMYNINEMDISLTDRGTLN